jgi:hypothetical protein
MRTEPQVNVLFTIGVTAKIYIREHWLIEAVRSSPMPGELSMSRSK